MYKKSETIVHKIKQDYTKIIVSIFNYVQLFAVNQKNMMSVHVILIGSFRWDVRKLLLCSNIEKVVKHNTTADLVDV